jgi:hypothetical protein
LHTSKVSALDFDAVRQPDEEYCASERGHTGQDETTNRATTANPEQRLTVTAYHPAGDTAQFNASDPCQF